MTVYEYTIDLISDVINERNISEKPEELEFRDLFDFARFHKLENMCFAGVSQLHKKPDDVLMKQWFMQCGVNLAQEEAQEKEKKRLTDALRKEGIRFLPLKGWFLRDMYPQKDYRFMSDLDILIDRGNQGKAMGLMHRLGYAGGLGDSGFEDAYTLKPYLHVELHYDLVSMEHMNWYEYYRSIWDKAIPKDSCEHYLNWDDYFIYMVINFKKDYVGKGTGIRSVLDFYVFMEKHGNDLDFGYIRRELTKLDAWELTVDVLNQAECWFNPARSQESSAEKTDLNSAGRMEAKLIRDGIYGSSGTFVESRYSRFADRISFAPARKALFLIWRAFPGMKEMKLRYPVLKRMPFLLPFCWASRWLRHKKNISMELKELRKLK